MKDVFTVDKSCILLRKCNLMLSSGVVFKCWENISLISITKSILISYF